MNLKKRENIKITINGKRFSVPAGITVLEAARFKNIFIPTLCYLDNIEPYGGCRLCVVKIKNMRGYPTACTTPVADKMEIITESNELNNLRKESLELILSEHPYTCLVCKDKNECSEFMHSTRKVSTTTGCNYCTSNGDCELQELVEYLDLNDIKYPVTFRGIESDKNNPFYDIDYNLCILCGRCIRICNEERNSEVLAFTQRGNATIVGTSFGEPQLNAGCEFCGACVDVCPTGSISEKMGKWVGLPNKSTSTNCLFCTVGCEMNVNSKNNRLINVGPKSGKRTNPSQLCLRGKFVTPDIIHHPDRVTTPLIKKGKNWIEVSWNNAVRFIADKFKDHPGNKFGIVGSPHDYLEDSYTLQLFARKIMGSNNIDLLSSYPENEVIEKIHHYYNTFSPAELDNINEVDTIFIIGSDASISHPIVENRIRKAYKKGTKIIFANSYDNRTSFFANTTIIFKNGEELSLLYTILFELSKYNKSKKAKKLLSQLEKQDIRNSFEQTGVLEGKLNSAVKLISQSKKLMIIAGDGILRSPNSVNNFNALYNIQLLQRNPDNCRIMFLLSEGNYYGGVFAGLSPYLLPGFNRVDDSINLQKWSDHFTTKPGNIKEGLTLKQMTGNNGVESLFVSGNIPGDPDLSRVKFVVQHNMFLNGISKYADVFLPATNFTETRGHIINLERNLLKTKQIIKAPGETKTLWRTLTMLAKEMKEENFNFRFPEDILREIKERTDLSFANGQKLKKDFIPLKSVQIKKKREVVKNDHLNYNYFNYSGNDLSQLIDDLKIIKESGLK